MTSTATASSTVARLSIEHEIRNIDRYLAIKARSVRHIHKWASDPYSADNRHINELLDQRLAYTAALEAVDA
jgi:hypothetical protein